MSKRISATAALGLSVVAFIYSDFALSQLIEPNGFTFVVGSLAPIVLVLARSGAAHWSESTLALGVPLGLLGGTIGVTNLSAHMNATVPRIQLPQSCYLPFCMAGLSLQ